jgi:hypothetical protein
MSAGYLTADRLADMSYIPIDYPRTMLNIGALLAIAICLSAAILRIATGGSPMLLLTYASLVAIEIGWLVGQAILVTHRN